MAPGAGDWHAPLHTQGTEVFELSLSQWISEWQKWKQLNWIRFCLVWFVH